MLAQGGDSRGAWEAFERAAGGADERAAAVARARLGRASAEELPWALAALGGAGGGVDGAGRGRRVGGDGGAAAGAA
ncbi:hypothetical protein ACFSTC_41870 [Nonomuraea ferruginea]